MPGFNGTGPEGNGSNTGRGRGRCVAATGQQQGQGFGQGRQQPGQQGSFADNSPLRGGQGRKRRGGRLNQR